MNSEETIWDYLYWPLLLLVMLIITPCLVPAMTWVYGARPEVWFSIAVVFSWVIGGFWGTWWLNQRRSDRRWQERLKDLGH